MLPDVPWRQWVLTVPFDLRVRLAWDTDLVTVSSSSHTLDHDVQHGHVELHGGRAAIVRVMEQQTGKTPTMMAVAWRP